MTSMPEHFHPVQDACRRLFGPNRTIKRHWKRARKQGGFDLKPVTDPFERSPFLQGVVSFMDDRSADNKWLRPLGPDDEQDSIEKPKALVDQKTQRGRLRFAAVTVFEGIRSLTAQRAGPPSKVTPSPMETWQPPSLRMNDEDPLDEGSAFLEAVKDIEIKPHQAEINDKLPEPTASMASMNPLPESEVTESADDGKIRVTLYNEVQANLAFDLETLKRQTKYGHSSNHDRNALMLLEGPSSRILVQSSSEMMKELAGLHVAFPNFKHVIHYIQDRLLLQQVATDNQVIRLPAILLKGEPGIGKTEFVRSLADIFGTSYLRIDLSGGQSSHTLTGSEQHWANSQTGRVWETLIKGDYANPVVLLDELEKGTGSQQGPVLPSLLTLLEPETAREFQDNNIPEVAIDASHVLWFAGANRLDDLAPELIDRMTLFEIEPPTPEECQVIACNIYQRLIQKGGYDQFFQPELPGETAAHLAHHHPRAIRKLLEMSLAHAARDNSRKILKQHAQLAIEQHLAHERSVSGAHSIGFLSGPPAL